MAIKVVVKGTDKSFLVPDNYNTEKENLRELINNTFSQEELFGVAENPFETGEEDKTTVSDLIEEGEAVEAPVISSEPRMNTMPGETSPGVETPEIPSDVELEERAPGITDRDPFMEVIDKVIGEEGGYSDNPRDSGGPTKYGIALNFNRNALAKFNIDDAEGVKNLTRDQAITIYREEYWEKSKADMLPQEVQFDYFTAYVNSPLRAVKAVQKAVGTKADGIIGPKTIAAIKASGDENLGKRIKFEYVKSLAESAKDWDEFGNGWANRYLETNEFGRDKTNLNTMPKEKVLTVLASKEPTTTGA